VLVRTQTTLRRTAQTLVLDAKMKKFILLSVLLVSTKLFSEELCPNSGVKVELDQLMTAEAFDKESALWALKKLESIVTDDVELDSDFLKDIARINALKVLEGYFLRIEALREQESSYLDAGATDRYCEFLEYAAWMD